MGFIQSPFRIRYLGWPRHISGRVQSLKRSSNQNQIMEALTMRCSGRKLNERNVESSQGNSGKTSTRNVDQILAHILAIDLKIRVQPPRYIVTNCGGVEIASRRKPVNWAGQNLEALVCMS